MAIEVGKHELEVVWARGESCSRNQRAARDRAAVKRLSQAGL